MTRSPLLALPLAFVSVVVLVACGGNVVVDKPPVGSGAGGTAGSASVTSSTTTGQGGTLGGNVTVSVGPTTTGSFGNSTVTVGTSGPSTGSGPGSCNTMTCGGGSNGGCDCQGSCTAGTVEANCSNGTCVCSLNGVTIGTCTAVGTGAAACDLNAGCCSPLF